MSFLGARGMIFYFCQRCYDLTRVRIEAVTPNVVSWLFDVLSWYSWVCAGLSDISESIENTLNVCAIYGICQRITYKVDVLLQFVGADESVDPRALPFLQVP